MKKKICLFLSIIVAALSVCFGFSASAQEAITLQKTEGFKWYKFGSVDLVANVQGDEAVAGTLIHVNVRAHNANNYPIVDGTLYAKIYKKQISALEQRGAAQGDYPDAKQMKNGDFLADQFFAVENIHIAAGKDKDLSFDWAVPQNAAPGEYKVAVYFQTAKKFNLAGLPFTDDVTGITAPFSVKNDQSRGTVEFDKNNAKINGKQYDFIGFIKSYGEKDEVTAEVPLVNTTDAPQQAVISWELYYWDALLEKNKISVEKETVALAPKETKIITHKISGNAFPVNSLTAKAVWQDSSSILNIRFARNAQEKARINFAGLSAFPLRKGQPLTIFSTAHSVTTMKPPMDEEEKKALGQENVGEYTILLTLRDKSGKEIKTFNYSGTVSGKVTGWEGAFTPEKDYDFATLEAVISDSRGTLDETNLIYDCQSIDQNSCLAPKGLGGMDKTKLLLLLIFSLPVIGVIIWRIIRRRKMSGLKSLLFFLIASSVMLVGQEARAGDYEFTASSVSSQAGADKGERTEKLDGYLHDMAYQWSNDDGMKHWAAVNDVQSSLTYTAKSSITDPTAPLAIGQKFTITDTTVYNEDGTPNMGAIEWDLAGYTVDSPPGCFRPNLDSLSWSEPGFSACKFEIYDQNDKTLEAALIFKKPEFDLKVDGPVKCDLINEYGRKYNKWECEVIGVGDIDISLTYQGEGGTRNVGNLFYQSNNDDDNGITIEGVFQRKLQHHPATSNKGNCDPGTSMTSDSSSCSNVVFSEGDTALTERYVCCVNPDGYGDGAQGCLNGCCDTTQNYARYYSTCGSEAIPVAKVTLDPWHYTVEPPINDQETIEIRMLDKATSLPLSDYNSATGYVVGGESYNAAMVGGESGDVTKNFIAEGGNPETFTVNAPAQLVSQGQSYTHASTRFNCNGVFTFDQGMLGDGGDCVAVVRYKKLSDEAVNITLVGLGSSYNDNSILNEDLFRVGGVEYKTLYDNSFSENSGDWVVGSATRNVVVVPPASLGAYDSITYTCGGVAGSQTLANGETCDVTVNYTPIIITGECGTADNQTYNLGASFPGSRTLCTLSGGTASPPSPDLQNNPGANVSWQCVGTTADNCSASRANPVWTCHNGNCGEDDCGKTIEWLCYYGVEFKPQAECVANGVSCEPDICSSCPTPGRGNWREVAP